MILDTARTGALEFAAQWRNLLESKKIMLITRVCLDNVTNAFDCSFLLSCKHESLGITGETWLKIGCGGLMGGRPSSNSGTVMADNDYEHDDDFILFG